MKPAVNLINIFAGSQQCHYAFQVDTYLEGCTHECVYCYARDEGLKENRWNNPSPAACNIEEVRDIFYSVFETDRENIWRSVLEQRIPVRLGGYTDCFMKLEQSRGVTLRLLKILKQYRYPHIIVTRSELVAREPYLTELDPGLTSVQLSIPSLDRSLVDLMEPGAPTVSARLQTLETLTKAGFWTVVRVNPLFPIYPDGYYSNPDFDRSGPVKTFDYFSYQLIEEIAKNGAGGVVAGVVHLSEGALDQVQQRLNLDLREWLTPLNRAARRGFFYSEEEKRAYYQRLRDLSVEQGMQFTTCYLGYPESHYRKYRDLWSNRGDCCNSLDRVPSFTKTAADIPLKDRVRIHAALEGKGRFYRFFQYLGLRLLNLLLKETADAPGRQDPAPGGVPKRDEKPGINSNINSDISSDTSSDNNSTAST